MGSDDYVIPILDHTIRRGGLFLAFSKPGGDLIGMSNFTPIFDESGWLGMARTDPDWRGMGVAQYLQSSIAVYARASGAKRLRFFVNSDNRSSLRAAGKGGFKRVAECAHVTLSDLHELADRKIRKPGGIRRDEKQQLFENSKSLNGSMFLTKMNGYLRYGHAFVSCNIKNLTVIRNRGELYLIDDCSFVLVKTGSEEGEFGLITGETTKGLRLVLKIAGRMKLKSIRGFLPMDQRMIRKALSLGFKLDEWGNHAKLFEKKI